MRKKILVLWVMSYGLWVVSGVRAEECDNPGGLSDLGKISGCISKYNGILEAISNANTTNARELAGLRSQVSGLRIKITSLDKQLGKLSEDMFDREVKVGVREVLLASRVKRDYVIKREFNLLGWLFSDIKTVADLYSDLAYRERLALLDREVISGVSREIGEIRDQSTNLKSQKSNLDTLMVRVDKQADWLESEVEKASKYVSDLGGKIAALTVRQNSLLAEKTGTFATSVGEVPLADDPASRPDYNPGFSPAFAAFSFGAPHFKGMSQYGAFGRAKNGQNYETILKSYYGNVRVQDVNTSFLIKTSAGAMSFEDRYIKGIAEMPGQWGAEGGMEALKAQAIAARSYALAYVGWRLNNPSAGSGSICVTESCQVWKSSKADNPGMWAEAVSATRGKILVSNASGEVVNAWYASTSGGYQESYSSLGHTTPGFWDTTTDWKTWANGAWEKVGNSPWFYKGWYKSRSGKSCGRGHPWLRQEEMADIVNSAIVVAGGGDSSGIFPEDVRVCWGDNDNPWSKERMAAEADKHGGRVTNVNSVRVEHSSGGYTDKVVFSTNRGEVTFSGNNFYKAFNLRAPGALALKSNLFNIEKK